MKKSRTIIAILCAAILTSGCTAASDNRPVSSIAETGILLETETQLETVQGEINFPLNDQEPLEKESVESIETIETSSVTQQKAESFSLLGVPDFNGIPYTVIHDNIPYFSSNQMQTDSFEEYSNLDVLGRCGVAYANIGQDIMPTEERGEIGSIKPTGWHTIKYDNVDGKYLYNRCHLIGFQLTGENANEKNLITGTRYLNIQGMLPFENMVADYVKETGNHVLYRVTPIFEGNNLLASGVLMEGYSVEDEGSGICYCIYAYNVQPGIDIVYATGESEMAQNLEEPSADINKETNIEQSMNPAVQEQDLPYEESQVQEIEKQPAETTAATEYILNTNTKKFHRPSCSSVNQMKESNKQVYNGVRDDIIAQGYEPCKKCQP